MSRWSSNWMSRLQRSSRLLDKITVEIAFRYDIMAPRRVCSKKQATRREAVPLQRLFTPDRQAQPIEDEQQLRASTRKLLNLVEREHAALVVFGHDGQQWQTPKKAPDFYG